jgi:hypothetical protein
MVPVLCTHVVNGKVRSIETILGTGGRGIKESDGEG